jgi:hypothetical protein
MAMTSGCGTRLEVAMQAAAGIALLAALALGCGARGPAVAPGERRELAHAGRGHEGGPSDVALAALPGGGLAVAFGRSGADGDGTHVFVARADDRSPEPVRVDPPDLAVEPLHQAPGLAAGPDGALYVSWQSAKPKPPGTPFASDLRVSRSADGGRSFAPPLRVNADRPLSHAFEGLAVAPDGRLLVAWIDGRGEGGLPATWLAALDDGGARVGPELRLGESTCVCCRVHVATGPEGRVAVLWRDERPGRVRDMVLALSTDGGRSFAPRGLVHADGWALDACPHRGGQAAFDGAGRLAAVWYTEGAKARPSLRLATADRSGRFGPPRELHGAVESVPDRAALALAPDGAGLVAYEALTAVRSEIVVRGLADGGRALGPPLVLSRAVKASAPAVAWVADREFAVAWNEEAFPGATTVVQRVRVEDAAR